MIFMSFAFVYIFSYSTSFRYSLLGGDSAVFQVVGKYWLEGVLPYKEIFDHKGSILYVINALGYAIYPRSGIMVPQIIFLYLTCLFIWRAMELYSSGKGKIFFLIFALIYYAAHYEEGNHVSEYSNLFSAAAAYCFLRSLKENNFPPLYGFVYGVSFGACLLIKLSDAAQICCQVFLIAIFLIQDHEFKVLIKNILNFCAGFVIIVLPFVIYFAAYDALYDLFYGTILFNLKYTNANAHELFIYRVIHSAYHFLPLFIMIVVALFDLKQKPTSRLLQSGLFIGTMMLFMLEIIPLHGNYSMIIFPLTPIIFAVLVESFGELKKIWNGRGLSLKRILIKVLAMITIFHVCISVAYIKAFCLNEELKLFVSFSIEYKVSESLNVNERQNILTLQDIIPKDERNSFVVWSNFCTSSHWLLRTDMKPRERLFMNNAQLANADPALRKEWFDNLRKDYPLWILYGFDLERKTEKPPEQRTDDAELEKLLEEKYSLKGETYIFPQIMKLYRLKD